MKPRLEMRVIIGSLIWIGAFSGAALILKNVWTRSPVAIQQLVQYVGQQRFTTRINFSDFQVVRVGDPVFLADSKSFAPIGFVSCAGPPGSTTKDPIYAESATITFYGCAPRISESDFLNYHAAGNDTSWVLATMLPPEKRLALSKLILDAYAANQAEIIDAIRPLIAESLRAAGPIIKEDLKAAFARRESRIREIGNKYQTELIEQELIPLIQREIWPLLQTETEPLATKIGQEIWQEVSVFRFGWRYLYDRSPLPDQNLSGQEFDRFVNEKALPILQAHFGDFLELQQNLIKKISKNERVRETVSSAVKTVVGDPAIQEIFSEVFREVLVDNARLKEALESLWSNPGARQVIELTSLRLEPTITEIGIALFGSPREKITPEFARVLRHRILHKDDRWYTLHVTGKSISNSQRWSKPEEISVRYADPVGDIPFAPARVRN